MDSLSQPSLKTLEEETELIENMSTSDHTILRDRVHQPTKKSLLELSSQDAVLAQNKLLSRKLEILTETLSKLPTNLSNGRPLQPSVLQVQVVPYVVVLMNPTFAFLLKSKRKRLATWGINKGRAIKVDSQASNRVLTTNKDSGDHTLVINSTKTRVDLPTGRLNKGLTFFRGHPSWRRL